MYEGSSPRRRICLYNNPFGGAGRSGRYVYAFLSKNTAAISSQAAIPRRQSGTRIPKATHPSFLRDALTKPSGFVGIFICRALHTQMIIVETQVDTISYTDRVVESGIQASGAVELSARGIVMPGEMFIYEHYDQLTSFRYVV